MDISLLAHRGQSLLGHAAWFEKAREVAALAQLRDAQLNGSGPRLPVSVAIAVALGETKRVLLAISGAGIRLISLGGEYLKRFDTYTGIICEASIRNLAVNAYFTSTSALSKGAAYHPDPQIVTIKRAMMRAASHRYLLIDSSKFGQTALLKVADLDQFDKIIVDRPLPEADTDGVPGLRERIVVVPPTR